MAAEPEAAAGEAAAAAAIPPGPARMISTGATVYVIGRHSQGGIVVEDWSARMFLVPAEDLRSLARHELC